MEHSFQCTANGVKPAGRTWVGEHTQGASIVEHQPRRPGHRLCAFAQLEGHPQLRRGHQLTHRHPEPARLPQPSDRSLQCSLQRPGHGAGAVAMRQVVGLILTIALPKRCQPRLAVVTDAHLACRWAPLYRLRGIVRLKLSRHVVFRCST